MYQVFFQYPDDGRWTLYSVESTASDARDVAMMLFNLDYTVSITEETIGGYEA